MINLDIADLNPHIRYCRRHRSAFPPNIEPSKCYDCRLFFFHDASGTLFIGNDKYKITNKTVVYLPPETEYKFSLNFEKNPSTVVINFDLTSLNKHLSSPLGTALISDFEKSNVPPYTLCKELSEPIIKSASHIEQTLLQCTDNFVFKNDYYQIIASALLKLCLLEIIKNDSTNMYSDLCSAVLDYIYKNFSNPNLTNEEIAANFNYHPYHLSNIIKKETGKTLHQFLVYNRIRNAKDMLSTSNYDISHIAYKSGFLSPAHFTYTFRKATGITPKEYRNQKSKSFI